MEDRYLQETGIWIRENTGIRVPESVSMEELEQLLSERLEVLVEKDFQQFVLLLYQVDVSEKKVKAILASEGYPDVYHSVARLIIDRQMEW
jgi:hypothetical protein